MGFSYERNLAHQVKAIECVLNALENARVNPNLNNAYNPLVEISNIDLGKNLNALQRSQSIESAQINPQNRIFDISMETGTGKTYTYTKMALALSQQFNMRKFIIIVPSLAIKANALNFLCDSATREHFSAEYGFDIVASAIESKKSNSKSKKKLMPSALREFVENDSPKEVHFLIINAQMLTAASMNEDYEQNLCDEFSNPFDALNAVNPVCIIDEPHRFGEDNKAWKKIVDSTKDSKAINPQMIFRYGATFKENKKGQKYHNLIYKLSAIEAFNNNLVKGVEVSVCEANGSESQAYIEFIGIENNQATFALKEQGKAQANKEVALGAGDSLGVINSNLSHLRVSIKYDSKTPKAQLNNQDENEWLKKGDRINLNAYLPQMQTQMLTEALQAHFALEKVLMQSETKIKPLTLFFIEDITSYRSENKQNEILRIEFEKIAQNLMRENLKEASGFYKEYLEKSLSDLRGISGGYFSKDNSSKEEDIANEVNEILHDKERLLDCNNIRRFIFSKWTLREGWDNPNVFVICKLRSSGSEISKLQEVGRGLRLPVNEYMSRVGNDSHLGTHYLHYIVNDSERDFAQSLISDINAQSGVIFSENATKLDEVMIDKLCEVSGLSRLKLQMELVEKGIIDENLAFVENGVAKLKELYPSFEQNLQKDKVRQSGKTQTKAHIRRDNYKILRELWETINQKVILEYKIKSEGEFSALLEVFLREFMQKNQAVQSNITTTTKRLEMRDNSASLQEILRQENALDSKSMQYQAMGKSEFLQQSANALLVNVGTLREVLESVGFESQFFNARNIALLKSEFNRFLFENAISGFEVGFAKISSATQPNLHPTAFTDTNGKPYEAIESSNLGIESSDEITPKNYLFDELFYDSAIERENILQNVDRVLVFTKIPKNALKIPVAGGISYTPDFAYVLKCENGEQIYCIIESKGKDLRDLSKVENLKISRAEQFLEKSGIFGAKIQFRAQFESEAITKILQEFLNKNDI
ncbi:type III restriction-modification system endonuclease [Helicobacter cinaedi]|uniref:type III restriction-modification system endonuclease n=1 Tax=Helicobacter cinaedi TaxID=213 RepID=UPI000DA2478C|nr:type III restriction-modification system endonuclease [Helicobacter cinaedi]